jgi:hypothetical protein
VGCDNAARVDAVGSDQRRTPATGAEAAEDAPVEVQLEAEATVDRDASSLRFIYPFVFAGDRIAQRAAAITGATRAIGDKQITVWERKSFSTDDLLAQVADFVDPPDEAPLSARLWRVSDAVLRSPAGLGGGARHPGADWTLNTRRGNVPFVLESVELALFRHGVGFVIVSAMPVSPRLSDWFTFLHFFRFIGGRRANAVTALRTTGRTPDGEPIRTAFFPELGAAVPEPGAAAPVHRFGEVIDHLLATAAAQDGPRAWWQEIFVPGMMLPHAAVFIDGCPLDDIPLHLHRLRNFFHSTQTVHPSAAELALDDPGLLPYAANQWFFYSLNGGGFLACDAPRTPFFRETLPEHIESEYLLLFLLALEQRFVLMMLSQQVSRQWVGVGDAEAHKVAAFTAIRNALLAFTAQGYFAQTMQEEHHHRSYSRWLAVFQLDILYRTVADEVREMHGYLELRQRERADAIGREQQRHAENLDRRLGLVTWLLGIPVSLLLVVNASGNIALVRSLVFGPTGVQPYDVLIGVLLDLLGIGVGFIAYRLLDRRLGRQRRERERDQARHGVRT